MIKSDFGTKIWHFCLHILLIECIIKMYNYEKNISLMPMGANNGV